MTANRMLTVTEVAEMLGLSTMTVYRMIDAEEIRAYRLGKRNIRIDGRDLAAYMQAAATSSEAFR